MLSLCGSEAKRGLMGVLALQDGTHPVSLSTCRTCTLAPAADIAHLSFRCVLLPSSVFLSHASCLYQRARTSVSLMLCSIISRSVSVESTWLKEQLSDTRSAHSASICTMGGARRWGPAGATGICQSHMISPGSCPQGGATDSPTGEAR